ncbi:MAG: hypothetical protein JXQ87_19185 [Bacteroidia bacterium]
MKIPQSMELTIVTLAVNFTFRAFGLVPNEKYNLAISELASIERFGKYLSSLLTFV